MHAGVEMLGGWGGGWCSEDSGKAGGAGVGDMGMVVLIGGWWLALWWSSGVGVGVDGC